MMSTKLSASDDAEVPSSLLYKGSSPLLIVLVWTESLCSILPGVFERAFDYLRTSAPELKEERAMLLEDWLNMESGFGSLGDVSIVQKKLPRKVKRKRAMQSEDGAPAGYGLSCLYVPKFAFLSLHIKLFWSFFFVFFTRQ